MHCFITQLRAKPTLFDISHQFVLPSTFCIDSALFSRPDISVPLVSFNVSALTGKRDEIYYEYYRNLHVQSDASMLRSLKEEWIPASPGKMHLVSYLCLVLLEAPLPSGSFNIYRPGRWSPQRTRGSLNCVRKTAKVKMVNVVLPNMCANQPAAGALPAS